MILRPYQEIGRDFLASHRHALLADGMRVGKTPQAILAAHKVGARDITVVCPAIAVEHWHREFREWWPGEMLPRINALSYTKATALWQRNVRIYSDLFIADECHFAKNPEAFRTKMVYGKDGFAWYANATWALSGTPAPKHAGELWPMLRAFGVIGMTYGEFIQRYCDIDWSGRVTGTKVARIPELKALLSRIMLRRTRRDVAPEMPEIDYQYLTVNPVSKADMNGDWAMSDERLLEYIEGHPTADRENRIDVAKAKVLPLVENIQFALENGLLERTVVFGWHVEPLENVVAGLQARGISAELLNGSTSQHDRIRIQRDFKHGKLQVIVANILAAGTAIDLSRASHGYFLELDWVPGNNVQAANRLVSMNKLEKVTMDVVTWPGSVDSRIQRVLLRRVQELNQLY